MAALLSHPHGHTEDFLSGFSPAANSRHGFGGSGSSQTAAAVRCGAAVHVVVGKAVEKTVALLRWTFSTFPGQEICLLHVHRPSSLIPTLLGKLPASRANPEMVAAFRNEEREHAMRVLSSYLMTCKRARVKASTITTEADEVQKEIVNLVNLHGIRKLVIGAIPDFMKGKKSSCKDSHAAKYAPSYCELWFVNKGKLIWTREASATQLASPLSLHSGHDEAEISQTVEECLLFRLSELKAEVDESNDEACLRFLEQNQLEREAFLAFNKVKALETAYSNELKLQKEAEDALKITMQEKEKLLEERDIITQKLHKTMRNISLLDSRTKEANRRYEEVAAELKLIKTSTSALRKEKQKLQRQKIEATRWIDRWRSREQCEDSNGSKFMGEPFSELPELSFSDLEGATCNFSESFRIGQGGYGVVYKGEMLEKTVAIKKLHSYNMQRQTEFHKTVQVLSKLHHPHLVELIGVCPESWLLVYEYLPGGSLQSYLSNSNNLSTLDWKIRAQIVANIASALLFLHSFRPKKIVHGNLKPENILLDSQNRCKISDYGDHMLVSRQSFRCPSFGRCTKSSGVFLYTDPESHRTGALDQKSDVYSFGVIILQLVTGRNKGGFVCEVRRALSNGKVTSVFDSSAGEWSSYVGRRLVELGLQCCESNGRDRPEMSPNLVKELECLPFLEEEIVPSFFLCPILREIMHDPHVAADGFTYEGDALRGWLENGHETSPMTNLKLNDLYLTPNHSLRLAIQDWIANLRITS